MRTLRGTEYSLDLCSKFIVSVNGFVDSERPLLSAVLAASLWGLLAATATSVALITLMTALSYANPDPAALVAPLSLAALMPSMFIGGFLTAKRVKDAPLLCGIISGGFITLLSMLLAAILRGLPSSGYAFWQSAALHASAILFSVLGAFAGNVKRRKKPSRRRFG